MKKFIVKTSLSSFIIIILIVSTNYLGDSAQLFNKGYENKIAKIRLQGNNVTNITNYDERILQREWISKIESSPDIVVLGSSRSMMIRAKDFKNKKLINNSVSGASVQDLIAIYQLYKSNKILPETFIIGLDPWIFNENNGQTRWLSLKQEYSFFFDENIDRNLNCEKLKQLVSISYFQSSFKMGLEKILKKNVDPIATDKIYNRNDSKLFDGSVTYNKKYTESSNYKTVNMRALESVKSEIYSLNKFEDISPELFSEFEKLCMEILHNDIRLLIWIPPYHPLVYEKLKKKYEIVLELENQILKFTKSKNIVCSGGLNPAKFGLISENFYDGMHLKEGVLKFDQIFKTTKISSFLNSAISQPLK